MHERHPQKNSTLSLTMPLTKQVRYGWLTIHSRYRGSEMQTPTYALPQWVIGSSTVDKISAAVARPMGCDRIWESGFGREQPVMRKTKICVYVCMCLSFRQGKVWCRTNEQDVSATVVNLSVEYLILWMEKNPIGKKRYRNIYWNQVRRVWFEC